MTVIEQMNQRIGIKIRCFLFICLLFSPLARAADRLAFSGFGTLGLTTSDSDNFGFRADVGTDHAVKSGEVDFKIDSLLGGQIEARLSRNLVAVAQAVLKERVDQEFDDAIELLFLQYMPKPSWSFRAGRTALDVFQITEYRNIGFGYLWARPPVEFYGSSPYRHLDGVDVSYTHRFSNTLLRTKLYAGVSESPIATDHATLNVELKNLLGLVLEYEIGDWRLRLNYAQDNVANEPDQTKQLQAALQQFGLGVEQASALLPPDIALALPGLDQFGANIDELSTSVSVIDDQIDYSALGMVYDSDNWIVQGELGRIDSNSESIPELINAYLSIGYRYNAHTLYTLLAVSKSDPVTSNTSAIDPYLAVFQQLSANPLLPVEQQAQLAELVQGGEQLLEGVDTSLNFSGARQKTVAIGWRWDFDDSIALKLQWDHTRIEDKGDTYWLSEPTEQTSDKSVDTVSLNMSFIF